MYLCCLYVLKKKMLLFRILAYIRSKVYLFSDRTSSYPFLRNALMRKPGVPDRLKFFWRLTPFYRGATLLGKRNILPTNVRIGNPTFTDPVGYAWQDMVYDVSEYLNDDHNITHPDFFYYILDIEQSFRLSAKRGTTKWGGEIGIRYIPSHFDYSYAFRVAGIDLLTDPSFMLDPPHKHGSLNWHMMVHVILAGGPEEYLSNYNTIYKYWSHGTIAHVRFLDYNRLAAEVKSFWSSPTKTLIEGVVLNWALYSSWAGITHQRARKWSEVSALRTQINRRAIRRVGPMRVFLNFLRELHSGIFFSR